MPAHAKTPRSSAAVNEPRRGLRAGVSVVLVAAAVGGGFYLLRTRSVTGPAGGV
jgi:hypothetical protein